jgi:hypothetical protein
MTTNWLLAEYQVTIIAKKLKRRILPLKQIVIEIQKNPEEYSQLQGPSNRAIYRRINPAIKSLGWIPWNKKRGTTCGKIFIVPWIPEDPITTKARSDLK